MSDPKKPRTFRPYSPRIVRHSMKRGIGAKGVFTLTLYGPDGRVKQEGKHDNLVVDTGVDWLRDYFSLGCNPTDQPAPMCYLAVGTNNTAASPADVALGSELDRQLVDTITTGGTGVVSVMTTFAAGDATGALVECGMFNDAVAGDMFDRSTFSVYNKGAGDTLKVSYSVTFSSV